MKSIKILLPIVLCVLATSAHSQERRNIFADPKNLKVLPEDIKSEDLGMTMKGFTQALGVRCSTCHVGEEGMPIFEYDFESDEKPMKRSARLMLQMVEQINSELVPTLNEVEETQRVEVRCVTCHRGRPQPKLIEDVLDEMLADGGLDAALEEYGSLRENYYGSHSFDFSAGVLSSFAESLAGRGELDSALEFAKIGAVEHPESYMSHFVLAEIYREVGDPAAALEGYERAIELNPRAKQFLAPRMEEIQAGED